MLFTLSYSSRRPGVGMARTKQTAYKSPYGRQFRKQLATKASRIIERTSDDSDEEQHEISDKVSQIGSRASGLRKNLVCSHCKEEKPLGEFLWCHQYNHVTPSLHAASKWRGQKVAHSCIRQMKVHRIKMDFDCHIVKSTIDASLEKLKRKLHQSVDAAFARKKAKIGEEIAKIEVAFPSVEADAVVQPTGDPAKISSLLAHVQVVGFTGFSSSESIFKSPTIRGNLPFDELAKLIFDPECSGGI